jgi:hypothetical protein
MMKMMIKTSTKTEPETTTAQIQTKKKATEVTETVVTKKIIKNQETKTKLKNI